MSNTDRRLARLRQSMAKHDLRALIISKPENRRYFSGFSGEDSGADSAGMLIVGPSWARLVTDARYVDRAAEEAPDLEVVRRGDEWAQTMAEVVGALAVYPVGFEEEHLTCQRGRALEDQARGRWALVPTLALGDDLRAVKDDQEIAHTRRAAEITDAAFGHFLTIARPGMTERVLAWELERFMRENGAEGLAFPVHVAAGAHAAMPHAPLTDHPLAPGEAVIVDMGARVEGYCADMTRTIMVAGGAPGEIEQFRTIYGIVLQAQQAAMSSIRAGMTGQEADALAREVITAAGYADGFTHGLGHGVGLEIHEQPSLRKTAEGQLSSGMLVTVEPGIYQSGWGGVRIEDLAVVHDGGLEALSRSTKELIIIGE